MSITWRDAVEQVAKYAPAVATALGGPGTGLITKGASDMVTGLLGIDNTPEALIGATQDPAKREVLIRLNNEHERELLSLRMQAEQVHAQEETKRLSSINETMRAEATAEGWFKSGWRPFNGWALGFSLSAVNLGLIFIVLREPLELPNVVEVLIWSVTAQAAVQGVNIKKRSDDKQVRMGKSPATFMESLHLKRKE